MTTSTFRARYTLTFRIKLEDRALPDGTTAGGALGRWVFHCHIFFHATNGMLGELVVVPAVNGNEKPFINADATKVAVTEPATATMTGTFKDPENSVVLLSASFGTVTVGPGGTWSWSRRPTSAGDPRFVYITATDPAKAQDQTAFELAVAAPAPVPGADARARDGGQPARDEPHRHGDADGRRAAQRPQDPLHDDRGEHARAARRSRPPPGPAAFTYTGITAGEDTIKACFDANGDGACNTLELSASATKRWVLPSFDLDNFKCYAVTPTTARSAQRHADRPVRADARRRRVRGRRCAIPCHATRASS